MKIKYIIRPIYSLMLLVVLTLTATGIRAQLIQKNNLGIAEKKIPTEIPFDPKVVRGQLPNGLSYYIRKNSEPKNRVTIYLVNKVGSILENEQELGLSHFLEHMAFNGTKHFPKNELVNYLQKSGVKFGSDLNAYTIFDETVYQLPLPTDNAELLHNGFQIMRDWAQEATLDSVEIEKERGVILEEKRLSKSSQERLREQYFPMLVNNSLYARRIPIGTDEVLKGFKRSAIVNYYKKWYRPNLQALIVVGDIDVAATEQTIKSMFSDLKNPSPCPVRKDYNIALTGKNQFFCATDQEVPLPAIQVFVKYEKEKLITLDDYKTSICRNLFNIVLAERISDLTRQPNSPFIEANAQAGNFISNLDAFTVTIASKPEMLEKSFRTVWSEFERFKQHGVTESELSRAKSAIAKGIEAGYNERSKIPSGSYTEEYVRHFLEGEASPGIEFEFKLIRQILAEIETNDIALVIGKYLADVNRDILVIGSDKDKLPAEKDILKWMNVIQNTVFAPMKETMTNVPLLAQLPVPGKITAESKNDSIGITTLTLSNGVKVVLKPTDFKNDEIVFNAFSPGGTSLYSDAEYESANAAVDVVTTAGLAEFSLSDLQKYMTGKRVSISPFISERFEGFNGNTSPEDFETLLQSLYAYFVLPRKDFSVYNGEFKRAKSTIGERYSNPSTVFSDTISAILGNYSVRRTGISAEKLNRINTDRAYEIYKERFADAGDFNFTFVGNFDIEIIKPLLEMYIGSLPAMSANEAARNLNIHIPEGRINKKVYKGHEQKSTVRLVISGKYIYGEEENNKLDALASLLSIKLIEKLREEESGVYNVGAKVNYSKYPENRYSFSISFGCAPSNVERMIKSVNKVIKEIKKNAPAQEDVDKVINEDLRTAEIQFKTNNFWLNYLVSKQQLNEGFASVLNYENAMKKITQQGIQEAAKKYLTTNNFIRFCLYPEKMK